MKYYAFRHLKRCRSLNDIYEECKHKKNRSSHLRCSMKKCVLRNFVNFAVKHVCQSLFFNKVEAWGLEKGFGDYWKWLFKMFCNNNCINPFPPFCLLCSLLGKRPPFWHQSKTDLSICFAMLFLNHCLSVFSMLMKGFR